MTIKLDDETLDLMIERLTTEDVLFLEFLLKKKAINSNMGLTKTSILKGIAKLTDFKFQICANRLYMALLVDRSNTSKPITYFITKAGCDILKKYKKNIIETMGSMKE